MDPPLLGQDLWI